MKVEAVKLALTVDKHPQAADPSTRSFESVRTQLERALQEPALKQVERILQMPTPAPKDLLMAQIKINEFHLKVEFVSKAAESGLATLRKFQQGQ